MHLVCRTKIWGGTRSLTRLATQPRKVLQHLTLDDGVELEVVRGIAGFNKIAWWFPLWSRVVTDLHAMGYDEHNLVRHCLRYAQLLNRALAFR